MENLFDAAPAFIVEMRRVQLLCEGSTFYRVMYHHFSAIKWGLYALVVLVNLNVLMVTFGAEAGPAQTANAYNNIFAKMLDMGDDATSVTITVVLGVVNFLGYTAVIVFLGLTEVPMLVHHLDAAVAAAVANPNIHPSSYRNPMAFLAWGLVQVVFLMFQLMHSTNYDPR